MKRLFIILLAVVSFGVEAALAQNISPMELKNARLAVYEWFEDYESNPLIEKRDPRTKFYSLFADSTVNIVNDFFCHRDYKFNSPTISVSSYCDLFDEQKGSMYKMGRRIVNKKLVSERLEGDVLKYEIDFEEIVGFVDTDTADDRYEYPNIKLKCRAYIEYEYKGYGSAKATYIELKEGIDEFVVLHQNFKPYNLYTTESQLKNNTDSLLNTNVPMLNYKYNSCEFDSKMYELQCDTIKWAAFFCGSIGDGFWGTISNNLYSDMNPKSKLNYCIDFGIYRQLNLKGNNRLGIEFGLSYKQTNLNINNIYGDRYSSVDTDGGSYERIIAVTNYDENLARYAAGLPIAIRYDYFMMAGRRKRFSVSAKLGVLPMYDFKQVSSFTADAQYCGYYDWLWGVTIDQNDVYDFGNYAIGNRTNNTAIDKFSLDAFATFGLSYYVTRRVSIDLSAVYFGTVYNRVKHTDNYHLTNDRNDWNSASWMMKKYSLHSINFMLQMNYYF